MHNNNGFYDYFLSLATWSKHCTFEHGRISGQALIEWSLVMMVLLGLCVGGVDMGRAYGAYIGLTNAARDGARYAVLVPSATDTQVKSQARAEQTTLGVTDSMITVDRTQAGRRTVTITYPFTPITPFIANLGDGSTLTLRTWAVMPMTSQ